MANSNTEAEGCLMPYWMKFFDNAGIPVGDATNYSLIFIDHRIQPSMLLDLNKEYLTHMGINVMGDVIAILKQAKVADTLSRTARTQRVTTQTPTTAPATSHRATAAARIINHYTGRDPDARPLMEPNTEPVETSTPTFSRGSVFKRLGGTSSGRQSPMSVRSRLGRVQSAGQLTQVDSGVKMTCNVDKIVSAIKNSLGLDGVEKKKIPTCDLRVTLKRPATSTCPDSDDSDSLNGSPLPYAGVLKLTTSKPPVKRRRLVHNRASETKDSVTVDISSEDGVAMDVKTSSNVTSMEIVADSDDGCADDSEMFGPALPSPADVIKSKEPDGDDRRTVKLTSNTSSSDPTNTQSVVPCRLRLNRPGAKIVKTSSAASSNSVTPPVEADCQTQTCKSSTSKVSKSSSGRRSKPATDKTIAAHDTPSTRTRSNTSGILYTSTAGILSPAAASAAKLSVRHRLGHGPLADRSN